MTTFPTKWSVTLAFRYAVFPLAAIAIILEGCGSQTPEMLAREHLTQQQFTLSKAEIGVSFANIPAAEAGRLVVTAPVVRNWGDAQLHQAVVDLRSLGEMDYLMLRLTRITDEAMVDIASLRQLRHLNLSATFVTDEGISTLCALPDLEGLYLESMPAVTGTGLRSFKDVPLRKLSLRGTATADSTTAALNKFTKLEYLDLGGTDVGDRTVAIISKLPSLRVLLLDCTKISNEGMESIRGASSLEHIVLCLNPQLSGSAIRLLFTLPRLMSLDLSGTGIEESSIDDLRKEFPRVKIKWSFGKQE